MVEERIDSHLEVLNELKTYIKKNNNSDLSVQKLFKI